MRPVRLLPFLCLFLALGGPAWGEAGRVPLLTLAYTANSLGEYRACPVCGHEAVGGLGRRATVFEELRAQGGDNTILVAGPYEFTPIVVRTPRSPELARALAQAYARLGYDLGVATPREREWLAAAGASLPGAWRSMDGGPHTEVMDRAGVRVAVVLFPVAAAGSSPAEDAGMVEAVLAEARRARSRADLVLGVSSWGEKAEGAFLAAAPGAVDLLLGAGQGRGYGVRSIPGSRTIWVRPPFDGQGVALVSIFSMPGSRDGDWEPGRGVEARVRTLSGDIQENPAVVSMFTLP